MAREMKPYICGKPKVKLPDTDCSECDRIYARLDALEEKLSHQITISETNKNGDTITATVYGTAE